LFLQFALQSKTAEPASDFRKGIGIDSGRFEIDSIDKE
jgi:hypothetical protein